MIDSCVMFSEIILCPRTHQIVVEFVGPVTNDITQSGPTHFDSVVLSAHPISTSMSTTL